MPSLLREEPTRRTRRPDVPGPPLRSRPRRTLLAIDGCFLAAVGSVQVAFELMSHVNAAGPFGDSFHRSPYTVGWVEAHGFAVLVGVLLLTVAARDGRRFWHLLALAVHLMLGTANLVFWDGFTEFGMLPAGVASTAAHVVFVVSHAVALSGRSRR